MDEKDAGMTYHPRRWDVMTSSIVALGFVATFAPPAMAQSDFSGIALA
jgi:hypothetical protein